MSGAVMGHKKFSTYSLVLHEWLSHACMMRDRNLLIVCFVKICYLGLMRIQTRNSPAAIHSAIIGILLWMVLGLMLASPLRSLAQYPTCPNWVCVEVPYMGCPNTDAEIVCREASGLGPANGCLTYNISVPGGTVIGFNNNAAWPSGQCSMWNWISYWNSWTVRWNSAGWKFFHIDFYVNYTLPNPPYYYSGYCSVYQSIYIQPGPTFSLGPDTTLFWGDSLLLHSLPLQTAYQWQNGSTDSTFMVHSPGDYAVSVTGPNGCVSSDTIHVNFVPLCNATVQLGADTVICNGSSIALDAGAGFTNYIWSNGTTSQSLVTAQSGSYSIVALDSNLCAGLDTIEVSMPAILSLLDSTECAGDSIRLTAPMGYASYSWSNGHTGDSIWASFPGTYSLTVLDSNGCNQMDTIQVALLAPPLLLGPDAMKCPNIAYAATSPSGYASYQWSSGASSQSIQIQTPGIYNLQVVDGFGCSISDQIQILNYAWLPAYLGADTTLCEGDSIILTPSTSYLDYLWQDSSTQSSVLVDSSGSFWVNVLDSNGCQSSDSIQVIQHPAPSIPTISPLGPVTICDGDSIILQATPNLFGYAWSHGASTSYTWINQAGNYTVSVSNNWGCQAASLPVSVVVSTVPTHTILQSNDTLFCVGAASSYQWYINGNPIPGAINSYFVTTVGGSYSVRVSNALGCQRMSASVLVLPTALNPLQGHQSCVVYPNPSIGKFILEVPGIGNETAVIEIYDASARRITTGISQDQLHDYRFEIDLSNQPNGLYVLRVSRLDWACYQKLLLSK